MENLITFTFGTLLFASVIYCLFFYSRAPKELTTSLYGNGTSFKLMRVRSFTQKKNPHITNGFQYNIGAKIEVFTSHVIIPGTRVIDKSEIGSTDIKKFGLSYMVSIHFKEKGANSICFVLKSKSSANLLHKLLQENLNET